MRTTLTLAAVLALTLSAGLADAATTRCRDTHGKFMKCPTMGTPMAGQHCRDMKTKRFAKCGAPGTEAVPATHH